MTVTDLIMELAKMPADLDVIYQKGENEDGFVMEIVEMVGEITIDTGKNFVMINPRNEE